MAASYLMLNELNNLDIEIFHCINQLKVWKKGSNIDNIYKQIININDFKEISNDYLLARSATLSNEQKIKIKLFNDSTFYSVIEDLRVNTPTNCEFNAVFSSTVLILSNSLYSSM